MSPGRQKGKSRAALLGPWSEWEWKEQYHWHSRWRQDIGGQIEFEFRESAGPISTTKDSIEQGALYEKLDPQPSNEDHASPTSYDISTPEDQTGVRGSQFSRVRRSISTLSSYIDTDALDPSFKVHHSREFTLGRIFKILWSRPSGSGGTKLTKLRKFEDGQASYHTIRRFLVISEKDGYSSCLPIITYGGQGTLKQGVRAEDHTIIYTSASPKPFEGERMTRRAIRVEPETSQDELDPASRLNYAKTYTVTHNTKVKFMGKVVSIDEQALVTDYISNLGPPTGRLAENKTSAASDSISWSPSLVKEENSQFAQDSYEADPKSGICSTPELNRPPSRLEKEVGNTIYLNPSQSSSVESFASFGITRTFQSSFSSANDYEDAGERLVTFLMRDAGLLSLYGEIVERLRLYTFERKLVRCLIQFSAQLEVEGLAEQGDAGRKTVFVARLTRRLARHAANCVVASFGQQSSTKVYYSLREQDEHDSDWDEREGVDWDEREGDPEDDLGEDTDSNYQEKVIDAVIVSSAAFANLKDNLRLFVHPNAVESALIKVWPVTHLRNVPLELTYCLEWEIPKFLEEYLPHKQGLGDIMTLSGAIVIAKASRCGDYMKEKWPAVSGILLEGLQKVAVGYVECIVENNVANIELSSFKSEGPSDQVRLKVKATFGVHADIVSAVRWISSALRCSSTAGIFSSSTLIKTQTPNKKTTPKLSVNLCELAAQPTAGACWHALLPQIIIARDETCQKRTFGKGLEIAFNDMVLLSRCISFVEHQGALLLDGLNTVLIPVAISADGDSVQWHYESKIVDGIRNPHLSDLLERIDLKDWYKVSSPDELTGRRCFLGWSNSTEFSIGTSSHFHETKAQVTYSRAASSSLVCHVKSYATNLAASVQMTFGATLTFTPLSMPMGINSHVNSDLKDILREELSARTRGSNDIFVYDNGTQIGWFLPKAVFVLYMVHHIINERGCLLVDDKGSTLPFDFVRHGQNSADEACDILYRSLEYKMRNSTIPHTSRSSLAPNVAGESESYLASLIQHLWLDLDHIASRLESAEAEFLKAGQGAPKFLHGIEFIDLIRAKSSAKSMGIKAIKLEQPWSQLTLGRPVIFCRGIGQLIRPADQGLCSTWSKVPPRKNYMVIMGRSLRPFLEMRRRGLGKGLRWDDPDTAIRSHCCYPTEKLIHTQRLRPTSITERIGKVALAVSRSWTKKPPEPEEDDADEGDSPNQQILNSLDTTSSIIFHSDRAEPCGAPPAHHMGCSSFSCSKNLRRAESSVQNARNTNDELALSTDVTRSMTHFSKQGNSPDSEAGQFLRSNMNSNLDTSNLDGGNHDTQSQKPKMTMDTRPNKRKIAAQSHGDNQVEGSGNLSPDVPSSFGRRNGKTPKNHCSIAHIDSNGGPSMEAVLTVPLMPARAKEVSKTTRNFSRAA